MKKINFSKKNILKKDLSKINKVLLSGWLAHGKYTEDFQKEFLQFTKSKYSSIVSSCTAGLHLSCLALDIKKGDEVIVPAMTHVATAHSVEFTGAKAVFCDIDYKTGNIDPAKIVSKINRRTKAIIVVHMAGKIVDIRNIILLCKKYKIKLIEDCAHALGSTFDNKHAGTFGDIGVFSFYPTKQITTGEGGIVITNSKKLISKIKSLKSFGINTLPQERKVIGSYDVKELGYHYRMTDFQAAIGYTQLIRYKKELKNRSSNALYMFNLLSKIDGIYTPPFSKNDSYFVFQIFFKNQKIRNSISKKLKSENIGFSVHYMTPVPYMTYYRKKYNYKSNEFPESLKYSQNSISLPVHGDLNKKDMDRIFNTLKNFLL